MRPVFTFNLNSSLFSVCRDQDLHRSRRRKVDGHQDQVLQQEARQDRSRRSAQSRLLPKDAARARLLHE